LAQRRGIKDAGDSEKSMSFSDKERLYDGKGRKKLLPLDELNEAHINFGNKFRANLMLNEAEYEGAMTRSRQKINTQRNAYFEKKRNRLVPLIDKHLKTMKKMLKQAKKQVVAAQALWTMECALGCPSNKDDMQCLLKHKQSFECHPYSPCGSPRSD
jgi:hypothetical protein